MVFFAIGFETTAPANAMAVWLARKRRLQQLQRPRLARARAAVHEAILQAPGQPRAGLPRAGARVHGHGHDGVRADRRRYRVPIVVTGFEPLDMLEGILRTVRQLEEGRAEVENQYARAVRPEGNPASRRLLDEVFEVCDRKWRGIGLDPQERVRLRHEYRDHDAERIFEVDEIETQESPLCISGQVLKGLKKPHDCPAFGTECTPQTPLGATMVSPRERAPRTTPTGGTSSGASQCRNRTSRELRTRGPERLLLMDLVNDSRACCYCPLPHALRAHSAGPRQRGQLTQDLIQALLPAFEPRARGLEDQATVDLASATRPPGAASPSPPTPSSSARSSSPAATSAGWPSTAP